MESQLAQLWDGSKYALLIGAILNHIQTISEALLSFKSWGRESSEQPSNGTVAFTRLLAVQRKKASHQTKGEKPFCT